MGSTERWERHAAAMGAALTSHDALLRATFGEYGGQIFKTVGDAFCAVFARAPGAAAAAVEVQRRLQAEPWGEIGALDAEAAPGSSRSRIVEADRLK